MFLHFPIYLLCICVAHTGWVSERGDANMANSWVSYGNGRDVRVPRPFQETFLYVFCDSPSRDLREEIFEVDRTTEAADMQIYAWTKQEGRKFQVKKPVLQSYGIVCNLSLPFVLFFWHSRGSLSTISWCLKNPKTRFSSSSLSRVLFFYSHSLSLLRSIGVCWSLKFLWCRNVQGLTTPQHTLTLLFVYNETDWIFLRLFEIG